MEIPPRIEPGFPSSKGKRGDHHTTRAGRSREGLPSPLIYPNILLCHLALFHVLLDSYVRQALHSQSSCMTLLLIHGCLIKEDKIKYTRKNLQGCHSQLVDKLMNCWTITSCWNNSKLLEPQLVTSLLSQQLRNKALTTCQQDGNQQC